MWEYKIYKTNLGYWVYRKKYVGSILLVQFLHANDLRWVHKSTARTFYTKDAAMGEIVSARLKEKSQEENK